MAQATDSRKLLIEAFAEVGLDLKMVGRGSYAITFEDGTTDTFSSEAELKAWLEENGLSLQSIDGRLALVSTEEEEASVPSGPLRDAGVAGAPGTGPFTAPPSTWEEEPAEPIIGTFKGRQYMHTEPQPAVASSYDAEGNLVPGRAATAGGWKVIGPAPAGKDTLKARDDGSVEVWNSDGTYQTLIPAQRQAEQPEQASIDAQIAALIEKKDFEGAQRLYDFKNQMTEAQREQAKVTARDQALRIAQSPGDWWTYFSRLYGDQPSVGYEFGKNIWSGHAGGLDTDPRFGFGTKGNEPSAPPPPKLAPYAGDNFSNGVEPWSTPPPTPTIPANQPPPPPKLAPFNPYAVEGGDFVDDRLMPEPSPPQTMTNREPNFFGFGTNQQPSGGVMPATTGTPPATPLAKGPGDMTWKVSDRTPMPQPLAQRQGPPSRAHEAAWAGQDVPAPRLLTGMGAPAFQNPLNWRRLQPSGQAVHLAEAAKYAYLPDYLAQQRAQFGGYAGSTAGSYGGGRTRGVAAQRLGRY